MAELALHIGDHPDPSGYRDGDVIHAFNDVWIKRVHAEHICKNSTNRSLMRDWCNCMCEFRIERLSRDEAQIVRISDGLVHRFESNKPFINPFADSNTPQNMDIQEYVQRRIRTGRKFIDGARGREIWWGGKLFHDQPQSVDAIWQQIEAATPQNRQQEQHKLWPCGQCDLCEFLFIRVDDFDAQERIDLESSQMLADPGTGAQVITARRSRHVNWQDNLGISARTIDRIRNKRITIDKRSTFAYQRRHIVHTKLQEISP